MAETHGAPQRAQHKIVVPSSVPMVSLLGSGDELLRAIEESYPDVDVLVRGNEITMTGEPDDIAEAERVCAQEATEESADDSEHD